MYSYTVTGINNIHTPEANEPQIRIRCKCQRDFVQQEIYSCISCTSYCCHYCTIPQMNSTQCRNCRFTLEHAKTNKCKMCFSCPYCSNVLVISRNKEKKFIIICHYCYWTSKEINIIADKPEELIDALNRKSSNLSQVQSKVYKSAQGLFKQTAVMVDMENLKSNSKFYKFNQQKSLQNTKLQFEKNIESLIKRGSLEDESSEYNTDIKYPQNLPLLAKKIRRCPNCKKALTSTFKTRNGEQKIQLIYKDLKILQCQKKPAVNGKAVIRSVRDLILNKDLQMKAGELAEVEVNSPFKVIVNMVNKTREVVNEIEYEFVVLAP